MRDAPEPVTRPALDLERVRRDYGQITLVFQGGGALGAYQVGVYEALCAAGIEPDWVIGTSIGAINAAIIAGNPPERRKERLAEFWRRVSYAPLAESWMRVPFFGASVARAMTVAGGLPAFFEPNARAFLSPYAVLGPEHAGYYSTEPLRQTLEELVDFTLLNGSGVRLTVGAADVATGEMTYFDSRKCALDVRHVMASGALPPAFPAVRIDDRLYWDGGIVSNTPVEAVFDDNPRRSGLVFAVHVWNPQGDEPNSIWTVMSREKDVRYLSRAKSHVARQKQIHKLRHVIKELYDMLPPSAQADVHARGMAAYGCTTRMHVMRLLAPALYGEDHSKDIDFSAEGIRQRREAGFAQTLRLLEQRPWEGQYDPMEGLILHEAAAGVMIKQG